ncbi:MAG TPA: DUF3854 domain-containing protein [Thermoanaerobaculia bacterium]
MRIAAGSFTTTADGTGEGYMHRIGDAGRRHVDDDHTRPATHQPATPGQRDAVYSAILDALHLSAAHAVALLARGLDEESITRNHYATAPNRERMAALLNDVAGRHDLRGVPGIGIRHDRWTMAVDPGDLMIPVRDRGWRIVGLQRRSDDPERRYRWCSSAETRSGAPAHHSEPWHVEFRPVIYLTEGVLKADAVACMLQLTTIALPGCGAMPAGFAAEIREQYRCVTTIVTAFDSDAQTNESVRRARDRVESSLLDVGFRVKRLEWDAADGKGLDDVLVSGQAVPA